MRVFTENQGIVADGVTDVTDALQAFCDQAPDDARVTLPPNGVVLLSADVLLHGTQTVDCCRSDVVGGVIRHP